MAPVDSRDYVLSGIYYSVLLRNIMWLVNTPSKYNVDPMLACLLRCWLSIKSALVQRLVFAGFCSIAADLAYCWRDYKLTPTQCLLNIVPASSVLGSIHSAVVSISCWRYRHNALNQSWVNIGPPSEMLAHIQRGAKHDTVTQYWANVGSPS